jgi:peptide deformylase
MKNQLFPDPKGSDLSVLPIYLYGTQVLRERAKPIKSINNDIIKLIIDMIQTMKKAPGDGLAANQVGSLHRIITIDLSGVEDDEDAKPLTLINPEILSRDGKEVMQEGCLSLPGFRGDVERAGSLIVRYRDTNFDAREINAKGLLARVIQHEIDHLDGVLFLDHVAKEQRDLQKELLRDIQRGEIDVAYPVIVAESSVQA